MPDLVFNDSLFQVQHRLDYLLAWSLGHMCLIMSFLRVKVLLLPLLGTRVKKEAWLSVWPGRLLRRRLSTWMAPCLFDTKTSPPTPSRGSENKNEPGAQSGQGISVDADHLAPCLPVRY